jgi:DNA-binding transcriptional regulator GbsR (MarR family)
LNYKNRKMEFESAKEKFIQTWGVLGGSWGINRTMAQIHALLLVSHELLSAEEIMEQLQISRGNANQNIRDLIDWGLVYRAYKAGERKEFFIAEKDIWAVAKQIVKERRKREIEPVRKILTELKNTKPAKESEAQKHFVKMISSIEDVVGKMDNSVEKLIKLDESAIVGTLFKIFK